MLVERNACAAHSSSPRLMIGDLQTQTRQSGPLDTWNTIANASLNQKGKKSPQDKNLIWKENLIQFYGDLQ